MFVDRVQIEVVGGRGGKGCVSFWREKFVPRGGPDGGNGGNGGDVIIRAMAGVDNLAALGQKKHWRGGNGEGGLGSDMHGKNGVDYIIDVPPGTLILDSETNLLLKDLINPGDQVIAARGGAGGKGNAFFKSANNRVPREASPPGEPEKRLLVLELKVIADVGLIGKPNAGKSTLLSRLSRARPEIAPYPFTTKHPNLGMVTVDAERSFVMADLPGLIEGASHGVGLGHEFLRHIERAGILVHVVEPEPLDGSDPLENVRTIRHELEDYAKELGQRPELMVVSKAELPGAGDVRDLLAKELNREVLLVSAVTGLGLNTLLNAIAAKLAEHRARHAPIQTRIPPHLRAAQVPVAPQLTADTDDVDEIDGEQ
jgi:GTP-binding protein